MRLVLVLPLLVASIVPAVAADHFQNVYDGTEQQIRFDHRAGNEWWIEVHVSVSGMDPPTEVLARAESGTWQRLTLRSWGNWASSFHIPAGERVQFQAYQAGGMSDVWRATSCFFTHPAGVEQCSSGATDPFRATFGHPKGNAWWTEITVSANRPLSNVYARVWTANGWNHHALTLRSWGAWAGSPHVPDGTIVSFLAVSGDEKAAAPCYRWTAVQPVECPVTGAPVPSPGDTRFDHKTGNEWWVEATVGPITPSRVYARDDAGAWHALSLRSWGAWAGSFHIEPGHSVQFRAEFYGDSGGYESCWFTHPQGLTPEGGQVCNGRYVEG